MAIRLRKVEGTLIALCAAETDPTPGDVYLDDGQHYALAAKFWRDYKGQTIDFSSEEDDRLAETQKLRYAEEEWRYSNVLCRIAGTGATVGSEANGACLDAVISHWLVSSSSFL